MFSQSMYDILTFATKSLLLVFFLLMAFAGILALGSRGKSKSTGEIQIKNLNTKFLESTKTLLQETLSKSQYKLVLKRWKNEEKLKKNASADTKNVFVIQFQGDIKASAVAQLREEVSSILSIATPDDEIVICLESAGGMVHSYGLAAAQLARVRNQGIPLTVIIDKVAASGGYLMACMADKILSAPFAIIGSIGVVVQLPNFHRLLKDNNIDFEQLTAGNFKRTLTVFGENTAEGRRKLQAEIEEIHLLFKQAIAKHRPQLDIDKVATGEHWLGSQAIELKLVDEITTSDAYLQLKSKVANLYEIHFATKKSFVSKFSSAISSLKENLFKAENLY